MMKNSIINFSEKTIQNIEVTVDIKEFKFELNDNTFKITVMKNNDEVVEEVFEGETIAEEVIEEPVVEEPVVEEPVNKKLSLEEVKKIIYENIPKKNTMETYFRTIKQVYDNFKEDDVHELLTKENEIIDFI